MGQYEVSTSPTILAIKREFAQKMNTLSDDVGQYWRPFFRLDIEWDNKERDDMQNSVNFE